MYLKYFILIHFLVFYCLTLNAQYFQFSQFNFTEQRINPSSGSFNGDAKLSMLYRSQKVSDNLNIKSTFISGIYPFRKKNGPIAAVGFSLLDDRAGTGGLFHTNVFGLNFSVAVPIATNQFLSFGVKSDWHNRRISLENLSTGSQFVPNRGFLNGANGELTNGFNASFITWSTGLHWIKMDSENNELAKIGFSLFDINRPNESFFNASTKLPNTLVVNMMTTVYKDVVLNISPDFLFTRTANNNAITFGATTGYKLDMQTNINGKVNFITRYNLSGYFIAGIHFENKNTSFGFSYDIPIGQQVGNQGALEFGLAIKKYINPFETKRKIKKSKYAKRREKFKKDQLKLAEKRKKLREKNKVAAKERDTISPVMDEVLNDSIKTVITKINLTDTLEYKNTEPNSKGTASVGVFEKYPYDEPIFFSFKFGFNKVSLAKEDKEILNDLIFLLIQNPELNVKIIGHTDDLGSENYNQMLSENRASAVSLYLLKKGIEKERIKYNGNGELNPIVPNLNEENRSINRRVEFVIHNSKIQKDDR